MFWYKNLQQLFKEIVNAIEDNSDLGFKESSSTFLTIEDNIIESKHFKGRVIESDDLTLDLINSLKQTDSDIVGVIERYDSDIEIDIRGQVTYNGIYHYFGNIC